MSNGIRMHIRELLPNDPQELFTDKLNYNFAKLLEYGVGQPGDKGDKGDPGPAIKGQQGDRGARGSLIYVSTNDPVDDGTFLVQDNYWNTANLGLWYYDTSWTKVIDLEQAIESKVSAISGQVFTNVSNEFNTPPFGNNESFITMLSSLRSFGVTDDEKAMFLIHNFELTDAVGQPNYISNLKNPSDVTTFHNALQGIFLMGDGTGGGVSTSEVIDTHNNIYRWPLMIGSVYNYNSNNYITDIDQSLKFRQFMIDNAVSGDTPLVSVGTISVSTNLHNVGSVQDQSVISIHTTTRTNVLGSRVEFNIGGNEALATVSNGEPSSFFDFDGITAEVWNHVIGMGFDNPDSDTAVIKYSTPNLEFKSASNVNFTAHADGSMTVAGSVIINGKLEVVGSAVDPFANGQLLIGNGIGLTAATLSEGEAIDISNYSGAITISVEIAEEGAGSANRGVCSFESSQFNVTNGHVTLEDGAHSHDGQYVSLQRILSFTGNIEASMTGPWSQGAGTQTITNASIKKVYVHGTANSTPDFWLFPVYADASPYTGDQEFYFPDNLYYRNGSQGGNPYSTDALSCPIFDGSATKLYTVLDNSNNERGILFVDNTTAGENKTPRIDSGLTYNPQLGRLTATTFDGNATTASQVSVSLSPTSGSYALVMVASATGQQTLYIDDDNAPSWNSSTERLTLINITATGQIAGPLSIADAGSNPYLPLAFINDTAGGGFPGNYAIRGKTDVFFNGSDNSLNTAYYKSTLTSDAIVFVGKSASTDRIFTRNSTTDSQMFIPLVPDFVQDNQQTFIDAGIEYNASSNTLTCTNFAGNASTASQVYVTASSSSSNFYLTAGSGSTSGNKGLVQDSAIYMQPSSGKLYATQFVGPATQVSAITSSTSTSRGFLLAESVVGGDSDVLVTPLTVMYINPNTKALTLNGIGTAIDWVATSDARLKTNVEPIKSAASIVMGLNGITYNWKEGDVDRVNYGFIAQDVEKILPGTVHMNEEGYKSISYNNIIAINTEAIKEHQLIIERLEAEVAGLKAEIKKLTS